MKLTPKSPRYNIFLMVIILINNEMRIVSTLNDS